MKRILIVDDAAFMRLSLRMVLERNGFEVIAEAENGAIGVEKYKEHQPDLVTLDITMPEKDGIEALKEIMAIDHKAKVIMVSAMGQESMVRQAVVCGAKSFIVKPYKEEHIIKTLNSILGL
jgi:two-component system, chemotaxis family, chemotaxis protein CheY